MQSIILQFCKQCSTCAFTKYSTQHTHRALQPLAVPPTQFHLCTFDFVPDLPAAQGFNCLLTAIDYLIKLICIIRSTMGADKPLAAQVTKILFENIVRFFGVPEELVCDSYPRFSAQLWRELWYILDTKPVPPLLFTHKVMVKVNAPIAHSKKSCICTFIKNYHQHA